MEQKRYPYVIVGGGLAGASAIEGIRSSDKSGEILLISREKHLPYHRPPLSKSLWTKKKKVEEIFVQKESFYKDQGVIVRLDCEIVDLDVSAKSLASLKGDRFMFDTLLLATGGDPVHLHIPGASDGDVHYFRTLDDYLTLAQLTKDPTSALIIGGGFIGTELAAALTMNGNSVTMLFPEKWPCFKVFPEYLGNRLLKSFRDHGTTVITEDKPVSLKRNGSARSILSEKGEAAAAEVAIAGVGITPTLSVAKKAGLVAGNGIAVNAYLQTSHPDIYAAGDNAYFHDVWLGSMQRVEHWDNALNQGMHAGKNMAGGHEPYTHLSYFFSDLFEFGYEAVGEIDSRLDTFADWQEENVKGVVYYLKEDRVRGALLCNVWDKVDAARTLIKKNEPLSRESLRGAIRSEP